MGAERATHAATWLVQHYALHGLLSVGFAGGLQAALATGDTLLPQQVLAWSGDLEGESAIKTAPLYTDAGLARLATLSANQAHLRQHQGTLLTVPEVLLHATTKQHLGQRSGALAADMESYSIGQVAVAHAIPFMPLRTIFDTCDDDIPLPVGKCISADGVVRPIRVLCALASHPGAFLHTVPMWRQAQSCRTRSGIVVTALLAALTPTYAVSGGPAVSTLVTGATGFIGANVVRALLEAGIAVRALVRRDSDWRNLAGLPVEIVYGDLRDQRLTTSGAAGLSYPVSRGSTVQPVDAAPRRVVYH